MKVAPLMTVALILCIAFPGLIQAKKKPKPKFCIGKNGIEYAVGDGYVDKEGEVCIRYKCVKKKKKVFMKENKCVDGEWVVWSSWSACTATCGNATRTKERTCSNLTPNKRENQCSGPDKKNEECSLPKCIDSEWADWSSWSACTATCGNATRTKERTCFNPSPSTGGNQCSGKNEKIEECSLHKCIDGEWADWSSWSACTATCGNAIRTKERTCSNPPPSTGGNQCSGPDEKNEECSLPKCRPQEALNGTIQALQAAVQTLQAEMQSIGQLRYSGQISTYAIMQAIATNREDISTNKASINYNKARINTNKAVINTYKADINTNKAGIMENKASITVHHGVLLHTDANYEYYKVPVPASSKMTSTVVLTTCSKLGMKPQCFRADYADSNCVRAPDNSPYGRHPSGMSQILCGTNTNPQSCASTLNMFWYMNNWVSGSACGATKAGGFCSYGKDYTSTSDMPYFAACLKPVTTDWTIIQRRGQFGNAEDYFYKDFKEYEDGFGSVFDELWIGLKKLADLTKIGEWELQVDLTDWDDKIYHAKYATFSVGPAPTYKLHVGGFKDGESTLGDSLAYVSRYGNYHNGQAFSARDKDQDAWSSSCAISYKGGWWYKACHDANLNGLNYAQQKYDWKGMIWYYGKDRGTSSKTWKSSVMKIKRVKV